MTTLIKRYPVVFTDENKANAQKAEDTLEEFHSDVVESMPHEFHELVRELLAKDPCQRLGSEDFIDEFINHQYFKTY